jgi:hypothetical protein
MTIPLEQERAIVVRLGLGLTMGAIRTYGKDPENPLDHVIIAAVLLGTLEKRPLTGYKLAQFLDLPRATVLRRLQALSGKRIVIIRKDGVCLAAPEAFGKRTAHIENAIKLILKAAQELNELGYPTRRKSAAACRRSASMI